MKRKIYIISGLFLFLAGVFLLFLVYITTFTRVPPEAGSPLFTLDWEFKAIEQSPKRFEKNSVNRNIKSIKISEPLKAVFVLEIPSIGLREKVYEGTSKRVLMSGPGHVKHTAFPGEKGNCVISGHRVTYGGPFRNLHKLKKGDRIIVWYTKKKYVYKVIWKKRVSPDDVWVAAPTELPSITLTTCDPPYGAKFRLVVRGVLSKEN